MSERAQSFDLEVNGRERMIRGMGKFLFDFERGANAHTPEIAPEVSVEPGTSVTDDEATYIAETLGSAVTR